MKFVVTRYSVEDRREYRWECEGENSLEALCRSGLTVWPEHRFIEASALMAELDLARHEAEWDGPAELN